MHAKKTNANYHKKMTQKLAGVLAGFNEGAGVKVKKNPPPDIKCPTCK